MQQLHILLIIFSSQEIFTQLTLVTLPSEYFQWAGLQLFLLPRFPLML